MWCERLEGHGLALGSVLGVGNKEHQVVERSLRLGCLDDLGEVRVGDVGHEEPDGPSASIDQAACLAIRQRETKFGYGSFHAKSCFRCNQIRATEGARNRGSVYSGAPSNIHQGGSSLAHRHDNSRLHWTTAKLCAKLCSMTHPKAALAMMPGVDAQLFTATALAELRQIVELVDLGPGGLLAAPDHELADIEVLLGSWGCPRLNAEVLDRLPQLRFLSFAAGTVKATVSADLWARKIEVSSAAEANAVPVAEFTFAAVVMIAKDVLRTRDRHRAVRGSSAVRGIGPGGQLGTRGVRVGIVGRVAHRPSNDRTPANHRLRDRRE